MDAKRGTLYTKLSNTIALAVREGGKLPESNAKLRLALERAKEASMPLSTIERAIQRGAGELPGAKAPETVLYEAFGPAGEALLIEALTDNRNRTASEIRHLIDTHGGTLAQVGGVAWMFEPKGLVTLAPVALADDQNLALIDAGADDIVTNDDGITIVCPTDALAAVKAAAEGLGLAVRESERIAHPKATTLTVPATPQLGALLDALFQYPDVIDVATNAQ